MNKLDKLFRSLRITLSLLMVGVISVSVFIVVYSYNPNIFHFLHTEPKIWTVKIPDEAYAANSMKPIVKRGYLLINKTYSEIGPLAEDPQRRFTGNNLSCSNCHLQSGTQAGSGSWVGVIDRFPQFGGRGNKVGTIEDRINGCMERSMNGKKLPVDDPDMQAIVAYMEWLGEDLPEEKVDEYKGYPKIQLPNVAVDLEKGKDVYTRECMLCHGDNGQGLPKPGSSGYTYPPLWGPDSFNDGAGMHRVITAAEFIKSNMPYLQATWDNPKLTDEEAYNVAGYINSLDRPEKASLEKDYPDRKLKPVSTPYGPWADNFSAEQHQFGPFLPIIDFYKKEYGITKTK